MIACGSGAGGKFFRQAMKTAYRSTRGGFRTGAGGRGGHESEIPMDAESVRLRKLAPKKKSRHFGHKRSFGRARY